MLRAIAVCLKNASCLNCVFNDFSVREFYNWAKKSTLSAQYYNYRFTEKNEKLIVENIKKRTVIFGWIPKVE